jgi:two-component system, OmpR family, osmolarity sensor histidine kinase EnvZ
MRRIRFSPRSSFARTLLLIVTLLFVSLVTTYLVVLNFAILPSLQQFNKVLAYEVRMLMTDRLQLEDGTLLAVPRHFVARFIANWASRFIPTLRLRRVVCAGRSTTNS